MNAILPDKRALTTLVHEEVYYFEPARVLVNRRYIDETGLLVGRYVEEYCRLNAPEIDKPGKEYANWGEYLPKAYEAAAKEFDISAGQAELHFRKSLDVPRKPMSEGYLAEKN
jgi:hypothetical protein